MTERSRERRRLEFLETITELGGTRVAGIAMAADLLHTTTSAIDAWLKPETSKSANELPLWAEELLAYKLRDRRISKRRSR